VGPYLKFRVKRVSLEGLAFFVESSRGERSAERGNESN
jgi:hypothetical protein